MTTSTAQTSTPLVHLSSVIKRPLVDAQGEAIGKVQDLIVRVGERHPPITGAVVRIEGRYDTPELVALAFAAGAHAVVVGTAITNPREITRRFVGQ